MNKNLLTNIIIINIFFLLLIVVFVNLKLRNIEQSPASDNQKSEQLQNVNENEKNEESPKNNPISGVIKKISKDQIVVELIESPHIDKKNTKDDLQFIFNDKSEILLANVKSQEVFAQENEKYEADLKEINDQLDKNINQVVKSITPPLPYTIRTGSKSDLKINSNISVIFDETIITEMVAKQITIILQ